MPLVKGTPHRHYVSRCKEAEKRRHSTGVRGEAVDFVADVAVRDACDESQGSVDDVQIFANKRRDER